MAFVEYLDDSSREVQASLYTYLLEDTKNTFLESLMTCVSYTFSEIKLQEKG